MAIGIGIPAAHAQSYTNLSDDYDGGVAYDVAPAWVIESQVLSAGEAEQGQWVFVNEGTVSSSACWPFTCGNGLNAAWNGYSVYHIQEYQANNCWSYGGTYTDNSIDGLGFCSTSSWKAGNDWVAIPASDGYAHHFDLVNVVASDDYGTTMVAQAWGIGQQASVDYRTTSPSSYAEGESWWETLIA